jgi:hypothetical protein
LGTKKKEATADLYITSENEPSLGDLTANFITQNFAFIQPILPWEMHPSGDYQALLGYF